MKTEGEYPTTVTIGDREFRAREVDDYHHILIGEHEFPTRIYVEHDAYFVHDNGNVCEFLHGIGYDMWRVMERYYLSMHTTRYQMDHVHICGHLMYSKGVGDISRNRLLAAMVDTAVSYYESKRRMIREGKWNERG